MKIRNGFVSNSSSSSFLIYGISFETPCDLNFDQIFTEEAIEKIWESNKEYSDAKNVEEFGKTYCASIMEYTDGLVGTIEEPEDYGHVYAGTAWNRVSDDETGKQFKDRVEKNLREVFLPKYLEGGFGSESEAWGC